MATGVKYVKEQKYLLSNINFLEDQKEVSPFYIKLLIEMCAAIFLVLPTWDLRDQTQDFGKWPIQQNLAWWCGKIPLFAGFLIHVLLQYVMPNLNLIFYTQCIKTYFKLKLVILDPHGHGIYFQQFCNHFFIRIWSFSFIMIQKRYHYRTALSSYELHQYLTHDVSMNSTYNARMLMLDYLYFYTS